MKIIFFGDSVTEGSFELLTVNGSVEGIVDQSSCYVRLVADRLRHACPASSFEIVNAGVGGDGTAAALKRIRTDVLDEQPDLVVVCFGLNDVFDRDAEAYGERLGTIFRLLREEGIAVLFMTPNMMNTYVSPQTHEAFVETAAITAACQNSGVLDAYMETARREAAHQAIPVADAYARWKELAAYGVDTTQLLANWINHPSRKMHALFADVILAALEEHHLIQDAGGHRPVSARLPRSRR